MGVLNLGETALRRRVPPNTGTRGAELPQGGSRSAFAFILYYREKEICGDGRCFPAPRPVWLWGAEWQLGSGRWHPPPPPPPPARSAPRARTAPSRLLRPGAVGGAEVELVRPIRRDPPSPGDQSERVNNTPSFLSRLGKGRGESRAAGQSAPGERGPIRAGESLGGLFKTGPPPQRLRSRGPLKEWCGSFLSSSAGV